MKFDITFMTLSGARHIMEIENPSDEISYFKLISYANNGREPILDYKRKP